MFDIAKETKKSLQLASWNNINLLFFQNWILGPACSLSEANSAGDWVSGKRGLKKGTETAKRIKVELAFTRMRLKISDGLECFRFCGDSRGFVKLLHLHIAVIRN